MARHRFGGSYCWGLAGRLMRGRGFGIVGDLVVGVLGAFIGGWLLQRLHIHLGAGIVALIVNALVGAIVLSFLLWFIAGTGWRYRGGYGRWGRRW